MSTVIQRRFPGGEISPAFYAGVDLVKYATGLRQCRNSFIEKDGQVSSRAGTRYITLAQDNSRMVPWESNSDDSTYILIFKVNEINFMQNGALVHLSAPAPAYSNVAAYVPGDLVLDAGVTYYCKANTTGNAPPNATYWHQLFSDSVGVIYAIPTPYTNPDSIREFQFVQDSVRMTVVHFRVIPTDIVRNSHTNWVLEPWPLLAGAPQHYGIPDISAITDLTASGGGTGGAAYYVTKIALDTFEESLISNLAQTATLPSPGTPVTLNWSADAGAYGYNVYRQFFGVYKLIFFVVSNSFVDQGYDALADGDVPPEYRDELNDDTGTFPRKINIYQQRTLLANFSFNSQAIYASKTGITRNFTRKFPTADDDSLLFQIRGKKINGVRHLLDLGALVVFTDSGEWIVKGDQNGVLKPGAINPEQYSYNGASDVAPVIIGNDAVYIQAQGSIVRALGFDSISGGRDGFRDADLTAFAHHLFKGFTFTGMAYQKTPNSIVWFVRSDGLLIGMTYVKEQQITAFYRYDTDGEVIDICSVPEGSEHAVYLNVRRVINGVTTYSYERMTERNVIDVRDYCMLDCALTYDGRNGSATNMTLSGGTTWDSDETLTLTASAGFFVGGDVGNEIQITGPTGEIIRFTITAYTSATVVSGKPHATVPVNMRGVAINSWVKAVDQISGLSHLEGKEVGIFADGYVIASPNNSVYPVYTVVAGVLTPNLPRPFGVIHIGLPYLPDIELLDIDTAQGQTIMDKKKLTSGVSMHVTGSRGIWVGGEPPEDDSVDPKQGLVEIKLRENEDYGLPIELKNSVVQQAIETHWNSHGRVFIRQLDPVPFTISSIAPAGLYPFGG